MRETTSRPHGLPSTPTRPRLTATDHDLRQDARAQCLSRLRHWQPRDLDALKAWVLLPHCMQTSARFWARVGFDIGEEIDKKESKMAMLRSTTHLTGSVAEWSSQRVRRVERV